MTFKNQKSAYRCGKIILFCLAVADAVLLAADISTKLPLPQNILIALVCAELILLILIHRIFRESKSLLVVDDSGIEVRHSGEAQGARMDWDELVRLDYRPSGKKESLTLISKSDSLPDLTVSSSRQDYAEAWKKIVSECQKQKPNLKIDAKLLKRLDLEPGGQTSE